MESKATLYQQKKRRSPLTHLANNCHQPTVYDLRKTVILAVILKCRPSHV